MVGCLTDQFETCQRSCKYVSIAGKSQTVIENRLYIIPYVVPQSIYILLSLTNSVSFGTVDLMNQTYRDTTEEIWKVIKWLHKGICEYIF